jgi:hypothetical protein
MSYQSKRTITTMIMGVIVLAAYCIYAFGKYQAGEVPEGDFKFWATTMLVFIGIGIVAMIITMILFHIGLSIGIAVKERNYDEKEIEKIIEGSMVEDEMDKLIGLKSSKVGFIFAGVGFVAGLISLIMEYSPVVMLNIMFLSFNLGSLAEGGMSLYYYRKGVRNG